MNKRLNRLFTNKVLEKKSSSIFLITLISSILLGDVITIDFETDGSGYSASATEGSGYTDVFNRSNPNIGGNSTYLWAAEDLSLSDPYLSLSQIDITNATSFTFSIDLLAHHYNDWDNSDELLITYSIDGGSNQNLIWVQNIGGTYNETAALDTDFDGDGECLYVLPSLTTGTSGCTTSSNAFETFSSSTISLSSNTTLDLKLQFNNLTSTDEGIYLDNIRIDLFESITIFGNSGFRIMSSPVSGAILSDLLSELWTQGMTGADADYTGNNNANVWTLDVANQSWTALSDISTSGTSLTAGEGFMVYVFSDTDNDGDDDLPVTLSVSGTENSSSATLGSIADGDYGLAGNPYASTIDWDLITKSSIASTCYVWDDATNAYISWNGSTGSLTDGLIAPYQGFWVQASGGTGSITIETSDKSSQAGTFYRTMNDSTGSASLTVSSNGYDRTIYVSFNLNGDVSLDIADAYQLMPMQMTNHLIAMTYADETALAINNLPVSYTEEVTVPLDVMMLTVENQLFQPIEADGLITWDISNVPNNLTLSITNQLTGTRTPLTEGDALSFTTELKDAFGYPEGTVNHYPLNGESLFALTVSQTQMASENETVPRHFALHPVYPNPFNPSTMISFDVPLVETLDLTSLQVYNIKGQLVETLVNEQLKPGKHQVQWNPVNLSSGTYVVKLKSGERTFTQKITYIK